MRAIGGTRGVGAAVIAGSMMALAYPGPSLYVLALLAWWPLLRQLRGPSPLAPRGAAALGLLTGTILHGAVFYWIVGTLETMSGLPAPVAWAGLLAYAVAMGTHQAAAACAMAVDLRSGKAPRWFPLRAGLYLLAAEWLIPFQFPWFLGNAFYVAPWLHQAADLVGIVGVSALTVAFTALLDQTVFGPSKRASALAAAALMALWLGYGAARIAAIDATPVERTLPTLLVQHNPSLAEKRSPKPGPRIPMFERARRLTREAGVGDAALVIWSEGALPFFYVPSELAPGVKGKANPLLRRITAEADALGEELGVPFLFGTLRRLRPDWSARARNSAILVRKGEDRWVYDKRILVPFGEKMPLRDTIPAIGDAVAGVSDLGEGDGPAVVTLDGVALGLSICYENLFPAHVHRALAAADVLVNLTDDVWFGATNAPELHLMVQSARSVEMRRPLLRATATGVTAHVDAAGRIRGRTAIMQEATLRATAEVRALESLFRHIGPWGARGLTLLALGWLLLVGRQIRNNRGVSGPQRSET